MVLSLFLLILIIVLYIICYHTRQKGDYETKEAKGADLADNPDMAVMYNQDGHPIPKRKEWFVWEQEGFLPHSSLLSHHRPWEQFLSNCFYSLFLSNFSPSVSDGTCNLHIYAIVLQTLRRAGVENWWSFFVRHDLIPQILSPRLQWHLWMEKNMKNLFHSKRITIV